MDTLQGRRSGEQSSEVIIAIDGETVVPQTYILIRRS